MYTRLTRANLQPERVQANTQVVSYLPKNLETVGVRDI